MIGLFDFERVLGVEKRKGDEEGGGGTIMSETRTGNRMSGLKIGDGNMC